MRIVDPPFLQKLIGQKLLAHLIQVSGPDAIGNAQLDVPSDAHGRHLVMAQRAQPLQHGLALGVEHAWLQGDGDPNRRHALPSAPCAEGSPSSRPVSCWYVWMYRSLVASTTDAGRDGAGGSRFHPIALRWSRTNCLSKATSDCG